MKTANDTALDHQVEQDINDLLTLREVADLLRIPEATLRYWRFNNTGPASFKIGRHVRYQRRDVQTWLRGQLEADSAVVA